MKSKRSSKYSAVRRLTIASCDAFGSSFVTFPVIASSRFLLFLVSACLLSSTSVASYVLSLDSWNLVFPFDFSRRFPRSLTLTPIYDLPCTFLCVHSCFVKVAPIPTSLSLPFGHCASSLSVHVVLIAF